MANWIKLYQFREQDSESNAYPLCLGKISKYFTNGNMRKTRLNVCIYDVDEIFGFTKKIP